MPIKYEIIPFDTAQVDEKGVKVIIRSGQNVKILFTDLHGDLPVFGIINPNSKDTAAHSGPKNGQYGPDSLPHELDLLLKVPIKPKAKHYTFTAEQIRYLITARDEVEATIGLIDDHKDERLYKKNFRIS